MKIRQISILLLLGSMLGACGLREPKQETVRPIAVEVQTMDKQTSVARHTYVAEIEEKSSVALSAQAAGRVEHVYVERGGRVSAGQILLTIDSTQAANARRSAEAVLRQAEDGFSRACVLYKEGGITEQKRVEIESQLMQARSMYASAQRMVEVCRVVAPVAGIIADCRAKMGETVAPGLPLLTIMNMDGFMVRFHVPESEIAHIKIGDKATIQVAAIHADALPVVITEKSMIPNKLAHSYEVVAAVQSKANLLPGMMAKVTLASDIATGFVLPQHCIQMLPSGAKVWVADGNTALRKEIEVGQYVADGVLVTAGIKQGDKVITKGYQKLWQGAEIIY